LGYVCKEPGCTEDVAWHLINGELDCIGDNRGAIADYATEAEGALQRQAGNLPPQSVTVTVKSPGYEDHVVVVGLTQQEDVVEPPPVDMEGM
jgi:hypothetical protein